MMALGSVQNQYLDGTYSMSCAQETYAAADRAVIAIIRQCHEDARRMLEENRELLDKIAAYLLKKETITGQEMMAIIEGRDPETALPVRRSSPCSVPPPRRSSRPLPSTSTSYPSRCRPRRSRRPRRKSPRRKPSRIVTRRKVSRSDPFPAKGGRTHEM